MNGGGNAVGLLFAAIFGAAVVALNYFSGHRRSTNPGYDPDQDKDWNDAQDNKLEEELAEQKAEAEARAEALYAELRERKGQLLDERVEKLINQGVVEYRLSLQLTKESDAYAQQAEELKEESKALLNLASKATELAKSQDDEANRLFEEVWSERSDQIADSFANAGSGSSPISNKSSGLSGLLSDGRAMLDEVNALVSQGNRLEASKKMEILAEKTREIALAQEAESKTCLENADSKDLRSEVSKDLSKQYGLMGDRYFELVEEARKARDDYKEGGDDGDDAYQKPGISISEAIAMERATFEKMRMDPNIAPEDVLIQLKNLEGVELYALMNKDEKEREDRADEWAAEKEAKRQADREYWASQRDDSDDDDDGWTADNRYYAPPPDDMKSEVVEIEEQALEDVKSNENSSREDIQQAEQNLEDAKELYGKE